MKYFIDIRFCRIAQIIYRCVSSIGKTDISSPRKKTTRHSISNGIEAIRETRLTIVDSDCLLAILIWTGFAIERNLIANIAVEQYGWQWWVFRLFLYQKTRWYCITGDLQIIFIIKQLWIKSKEFSLEKNHHTNVHFPLYANHKLKLYHFKMNLYIIYCQWVLLIIIQTTLRCRQVIYFQSRAIIVLKTYIFIVEMHILCKE